jgi:TonB family protein
MTFLLDVTWKSTALLAAACLVALCLRRKSAALRHHVWCLALAAILILPLLSIALPPLHLPTFTTILPESLLFRADAHGMTSRTTAAPALGPVRVASEQLLTNGGTLLVALWVIGAALSLSQMLVGWIAVERLREKARPVNLPEMDENVEIRETRPGSMPLAYGFFRPIILVPADVHEWSAERRRVVLLHELAHVRRRDGATRLLARFALALYWWHPLVWTAWRESLREQERAADDLVLNAGAGAASYASHLLDVARSLQSPVGLGSAALAMARPSQLEGRLSAILDSKRNRQGLRRASAISASLLALTLVVPVAALHTGGQVRFAAKTLPPSNDTFFILQGKSALSQKNYELAASFFERAQTANPQNAAEAEMWLAITQQIQENREVAVDLYRTALTLSEPDSATAATIMELYAKLLRDLKRDNDATKIAEQAARIRQMQGEQALTSAPMNPLALQSGGDVSAPKVVSKVEPKYSEDAKLARYTGTVLLAIEIGTDGLPRNIRVVHGLGLGLDQKAVEAVGQWKFSPGTQNGQPVIVSAHVEVNFRLL